MQGDLPGIGREMLGLSNAVTHADKGNPDDAVTVTQDGKTFPQLLRHATRVLQLSHASVHPSQQQGVALHAVPKMRII